MKQPAKPTALQLNLSRSGSSGTQQQTERTGGGAHGATDKRRSGRQRKAEANMNPKLTADRLRRRAIVYIRQSSMGQVAHNHQFCSRSSVSVAPR